MEIRRKSMGESKIYDRWYRIRYKYKVHYDTILEIDTRLGRIIGNYANPYRVIECL